MTWGPPQGYGPPGQPDGQWNAGAPSGYGYAPQAEPPGFRMHPGVIAEIAVATTIVSLGGGGAAYMLYRKTTEPTADVRVECRGAPALGFTCSVEHRGGNAATTACWRVHVQCANGAEVNGNACQYVAIGARVTRQLQPHDITGAKACNRPVTTSIEDVASIPQR